MESFLLKIWTRITGLGRDEAIVASSHFHAMAFWSCLLPVLSLMLGIRWLALGGCPWIVTAFIAEPPSTGRLIDLITRGAGCLVGLVFGIVVFLMG